MEWLWWLWHGYGSQERTHAFYSEVGTAKNCSLTWRGGGVALDHGDLFPFSQDHATGICAQTSDSSNRQTQTQTYAAWLKIPRCRLTAGISSTREQAILGGEREREREGCEICTHKYILGWSGGGGSSNSGEIFVSVFVSPEDWVRHCAVLGWVKAWSSQFQRSSDVAAVWRSVWVVGEFDSELSLGWVWL